MALQFTVPGTAVPQGSKQCFCRNGRGTLVEASKALKPWRKTVTQHAQYARMQQDHKTIQNGVRVTLEFQLPKPPSVKRDLPTVKPDLDKLTRAMLDGMTDAQVWADDSQVCVLVVTKTYASLHQPHVRVEVDAL